MRKFFLVKNPHPSKKEVEEVLVFGVEEREKEAIVPAAVRLVGNKLKIDTLVRKIHMEMDSKKDETSISIDLSSSIGKKVSEQKKSRVFKYSMILLLIGLVILISWLWMFGGLHLLREMIFRIMVGEEIRLITRL